LIYIYNRTVECIRDIIYTYPIALQHLAYFKRKGYADKINPKLLEVGGYSMDEYTRNYISDAFNCPVVNVYQSVESASDIAFECLCGTWHINNDFYFVETVNDKNEVVGPDEKGHIVLTRLFGKGTPIVRYTGMDDWVTIIDDHECECGLRTPILKNGVEGRISARIVLPDGRVYPAASFAIISLVLNELNTYKVRQFQIVQNKIDEIEIKLVIDNDLRDKGPSVELIFEKIKEAYKELAGPEVKIKVVEVKEIKSPPGKPLPLVISKVEMEDGYKQLENQAFKKKK
jgi:phenylacetate-coenzyme A ligase PaaK-like adenylate-forming protein